MKVLNKMPESGQFIEIWMWGGEAWSATYKYIDGDLRIYSREEDEFIEDDCGKNEDVTRQYIVETD